MEKRIPTRITKDGRIDEEGVGVELGEVEGGAEEVEEDITDKKWKIVEGKNG